MKKMILHFIFSLCIWALWSPGANSGELLKPFGFVVGKTSYGDALNIAETRHWQYLEYEKRQFKEVAKQDPARGKNTFLKVTPKGMKGTRSVLVFFNNESTLDAVIISLEPNLLETMIAELDRKYDLVTKSLHGEDLSAQYPLVRWQEGNVYIELQKPGPFLLRLIYVDKLVYENYKDFLQKTYEPYRHKLEKRDWMSEL